MQQYLVPYFNPPKLAAANGLYALAGVNLQVSTNLTDWTVITRDLGVMFQLRYGGSAFLGPLSFGPIAFSTDGQVWELTSPLSGKYFQSVGFANGRYGAFTTASSDGTQPAVSAATVDLTNWQTATLPDAFTNSLGMVSAGDTFFLLNTVSNGFFSSKDALNWQQPT